MVTLKDFKTTVQEDNLVHIFISIMNMDPTLLHQLLEDNINYEDIGKQLFIDKLSERFNKHKIYGDTEFYLDIDFCKGCSCDNPVSKFIGNNSKLHFALFFQIEENKIIDIYHCNWYGDNGFSNPF